MKIHWQREKVIGHVIVLVMILMKNTLKAKYQDIVLQNSNFEKVFFNEKNLKMSFREGHFENVFSERAVLIETQVNC